MNATLVKEPVNPDWFSVLAGEFEDPGRTDTTTIRWAIQRANKLVVPIRFAKENRPVQITIKNN
jgi:hypothetical protein